jgi:hypothetical protein
MANLETVEKNLNQRPQLFTKKQMKSYAEHCMVKLLMKYPNGEDDMGEISGDDLSRIQQVLGRFPLDSF